MHKHECYLLPSTTKTATTTDIVKDLRICSPTSFSNNDNKGIDLLS